MITQGPERNKRRNWSWQPGRTWWVHRDPFQETFSQLQLRTVFNIMTLKLKKICRCEIMSCVASFTEMHMLYHYKYLQRWNNICFCHITTHQTVSISQLRPFYYCCHYDEGHLTFSLPSKHTNIWRAKNFRDCILGTGLRSSRLLFFRDDELLDKWAFCPVGHSLDYWGIKIMGRQNNGQSPINK